MLLTVSYVQCLSIQGLALHMCVLLCRLRICAVPKMGAGRECNGGTQWEDAAGQL